MANKAQRKVNRWVRRFNKDLATDAFLGLNRFKIRQIMRIGYEWEQSYSFVIMDTKTGENTFVWHLNNYDFIRELFWATNNFIVRIRMKEGW